MTFRNASVDPAQYWEERARTRGAIAADYRDPVLRAFETPLRRRAFFANVPWWNGIRVLDVGTGTGEWAMEFWRRGATVVGIDISPGMIQTAREAAARGQAEIRYEVGKVQELPEEFQGRFDMVASITVLQHLLTDRDVAEALAKCARALHPGGRLACIENTMGGPRLWRNTYMTFRSRAQWLRHFRTAGFTVERVVAVRRVPLILFLYRVYARIRWSSGLPASLTWDGRIWCRLLCTVNESLARILPGGVGSDLTLFLLKRS